MNNKIPTVVFAIFVSITFTCFKLEAQEFTEWSTSINMGASTPVNLGPQINTADQERAPYLSDDGLTLILVSDRPGGFGGNDLYISTRKKIQKPLSCK